MSLHSSAIAGDRHPPYNWIPADSAALAAITIVTADLYKTAIQVDTKVVYTAIAMGSGLDKWEAVGSDPNFVVSGPTAPRTFTFPDEDATVLTNKTKADVLTGALFGVDTGAANAYVVTLAPAITAYVTGCFYCFGAINANTGASTVDFNSVGAVAIKKVAGGVTTDLAANDIRVGQIVVLQFDGTNMQMQSTLGNITNLTAASQAEMEAGTEAALRSMSPQRVAQAIAALGQSILLAENAQTGTTYTLVLADNGKIVGLSNAAAITLTVPPNSSVAFPVGTQILLEQVGAGQVTVAPGAGVTIRARGAALKIADQYGTAVLIKRATDTWNLSGDLTA